MTTNSSIPANVINIRGVQLASSDTPEEYRQKLARIMLDSMVAFISLLDAHGTILEVSQAALDAAGIEYSDALGKPFWKTFWWQVSEEVSLALKEAIVRASQGESVRWNTEIYKCAASNETIVVDASLIPVKDEQGDVMFITAEVRDITERKAHEHELARRHEEFQAPQGLAVTASAVEAFLDETGRWSSQAPSDSAKKWTPTEYPRVPPIPRTYLDDHQMKLVVLAEDNADMRDYMSRLLRNDYRVHTVSNGLQAMEAARRLRPDLILADVTMSGLDGFALVGAVRNDSLLSSTPVILLSARDGEESRIEGLQAGADDYLMKPFTAPELMARVATHIKMADLRREVAKQEAQLRTEAELERQRLEILLAQAPAGIGLMSGPEHRWTFVNDHYVRMTGRKSTADFVGKTLMESLPEIENQGFLELLDEVFRTGQPYIGREMKVTLNRVTSGKPEEIYVDFVYQPVRNTEGHIEGILVHATDVTDRKRSDENRFRLAAIVDSADDAIVSKDLNGIVSSWNEGACRMFGYTAEDMVGQSVLLLIPKDLHYEEDIILRKLRAGERIDHYETTRRKKNGETIEVSITISPIRDESGHVVGASKIARDISDRKRVERLLLQSEKLAATGRMAASIAHEINNPLESLMNLIFLARQNSDAEGKAYGYLLTAEGEMERVSHIARQTLGYYRDTTSPTEVYLHDLIETVLTVYNSKLIAGGITTDKRFNDLQKILVSKGELLQVFSNIVANAADAMRLGGTLYVSSRRLIRSAGDGIQLTIRDTGTGIPQEHLSQVFEPFFTTKGDLGTGIGLWVAKQLVESRSGQISIASTTEPESSGTTITIFIPFAIPAPHIRPMGE